jgi:hypothetical protein
MEELHTLYLDKYDFAGLVAELRDKGESPTAPVALKRMLRSGEQLVRLKTWLDAVMLRHNRQNPLPVHDLSGDATKDFSVYGSPDGRVVLVSGGAETPRDWVEVKPPVFGAIVVSALREGKENLRALYGAQSFARLYNLPLMTKALAAVEKSAAAR